MEADVGHTTDYETPRNRPTQESAMPHQHETVIETGDRIVGIARSTEAVSIGLLTAIDGTVDAMVGIAKIMSGYVTIFSKAADEIQAKTIVEAEYIDADDLAIDILERTADHLKDLLTTLVLKRRAIDCDCRLKEHHCEALHDAYEQAMTEVAELIEVVQATRAAIITHDLKAEPRNSEVFATVDALIADLRAR